MYGLGAAGEAGARRAFAILENELRIALALAGYPRAADLGADAVSVSCSLRLPAARRARPG
jgi:L-lactate dehydrogenase (cytochrome)